MSLVKDSTFFKNLFFGQKNRAPMQKYLCEMSENGYHLVKIGKFKCVFSEEPIKRYIYSLCAEGDESLYALGSEWELLLTFKGVLFYKKEVPSDAVVIPRVFNKKRSSLELKWLNARLAEGLVLIGRLGNEYIFKRSTEYVDHEYYIKRVSKKKKPSKKAKNKKHTGQDTFSEVKTMRFVTVSPNGDTYYFLKDAKIKNSVIENRGKRLSDQLLALFISTGSALAFCASVLLALFGILSAKTNGASFIPWLVGGGAAALVFASLFVSFFLRFQKIAEARKIRAEEKRARLEAEAAAAQADATQAQSPVSENTNNNNNIVMNTVVLNSYGEKSSSSGANNVLDPNLQNAMGQVFDGSASQPLDPRVNPMLATARTPEELAKAVMQAASAQNVPQYEDKTDANDSDIWQGADIFGQQKQPSMPFNATVYDDKELQAEEPYSEENQDEYETEESEDEYGEYREGFPLMRFIGYAVLAFISIVILSLSVRFCISWFLSSDKGNFLTLALSLLGIGFSPYLCYLGITSCRDILYYNSDELE